MPGSDIVLGHAYKCQANDWGRYPSVQLTVSVPYDSQLFHKQTFCGSWIHFQSTSIDASVMQLDGKSEQATGVRTCSRGKQRGEVSLIQ
jgi:hypothetical protein